MLFQPHVTYDGIIALGGIGLSYAAQWFLLRAEVKNIRSDVEGLKRGRGLILGNGSNWPDSVRRCFGFGRRERERE